MINIEEVADRTFRLEVAIAQTSWLTTVYFIDNGKGILVEPGPASAIPAIQEAMNKLGMKELSHVIPTHIHLDHAGAIGGLARLFPQAKVVLHPRAVKHAVDPSRWIRSTKMSFGDNYDDRYGEILPVPEAQVIAAEDGQILSVNGRKLQTIHAPGHASHNIAIFDLETRGLFCGETLGLPPAGANWSPLPAAAPPDFDLEVYLETMEKLKKLKPAILFYSHDGVGREPQELITKAAENSRIFGEIILDSLKQGNSIEEIDGKIRDYVNRNLGLNVESGGDPTSNIGAANLDIPEGTDRPTLDGYISYFKRQELV
ncbi:MBL fold metallo-hydrolase [Chloroflexota bacterium]